MQGARRAAVRALQAVGNAAVRPVRPPKFKIGFAPSLTFTKMNEWCLADAWHNHDTQTIFLTFGYHLVDPLTPAPTACFFIARRC
jgi:hypothetical protein